MNKLSKTLLVLLFASPAVFAAGKASTTLVSKSSLSNAGDNDSQNPSIATGGKSVAYESKASNLVIGDTNFASDVFVITGGKQVQRISINSLGFEARDDGPWDGTDERADSWDPVISAKATTVAFVSRATNLDLETATGPITDPQDPAYNVSLDTNSVDDIFVRDIKKKKTYRVSGRLTDCTAAPKDCAKPGALRVITETDFDSEHPAISGDGLNVVYTTQTAAQKIADNAQTITDSSGKDVFFHSLKTHRTELISGVHDASGNISSPATAGSNSDFAAVSPDGRLVVFSSDATNLVAGDVSDTGDDADVFAYDTLTHKIFRVSGVLTGGVITAQANGESFSNRYSVAGAKGRYFIAFHSKASNLDNVVDTENDEDVFVADIQSSKGSNDLSIAEIRRVSGIVDLPTGLVTDEANGVSRWPAIAATGATFVVSYESEASNMLTPSFSWQDDSNGVQDIYSYDSKAKLIQRSSLNFENIEAQEASSNAAISPDGKFVAFDSNDQFLVLQDANHGIRDVFSHLR